MYWQSWYDINKDKFIIWVWYGKSFGNIWKCCLCNVLNQGKFISANLLYLLNKNDFVLLLIITQLVLGMGLLDKKKMKCSNDQAWVLNNLRTKILKLEKVKWFVAFIYAHHHCKNKIPTIDRLLWSGKSN